MMMHDFARPAVTVFVADESLVSAAADRNCKKLGSDSPHTSAVVASTRRRDNSNAGMRDRKSRFMAGMSSSTLRLDATSRKDHSIIGRKDDPSHGHR